MFVSNFINESSVLLSKDGLSWKAIPVDRYFRSQGVAYINGDVLIL